MDDPQHYEAGNSKIRNSLKRFFFPKSEAEDVTEEEIISMVDEGNELGIVMDNEAEMIRNIFELNDTNAKDIMTHRTNIIAMSGDMTVNDALDFVIEQNYSRFPVYSESVDDLIGILHLRDIVSAYKKMDSYTTCLKDLKDLIRPVIYVPETRSIDRLFADMQKDKNHMVVVIDEYGQTAGIVTMEDILEEIVGNIQDEYDEEEEDIVKDSEGRYIIKGLTPIRDLEDVLEISCENEDIETLNGYLISLLERIPSEGENIEIRDDKYIYRILNIKNNIISRVMVEPVIQDIDHGITQQ